MNTFELQNIVYAIQPERTSIIFEDQRWTLSSRFPGTTRERFCVRICDINTRRLDCSDLNFKKGGCQMANQIGKKYYCKKCGVELVVTRGGNGKLCCCGQPMEQKKK